MTECFGGMQLCGSGSWKISSGVLVVRKEKGRVRVTYRVLRSASCTRVTASSGSATSRINFS
jgi:hypothetical protein